jgi:hypothetical protein
MHLRLFFTVSRRTIFVFCGGLALAQTSMALFYFVTGAWRGEEEFKIGFSVC